MKYTQRETEDWKAGLRKKSMRPAKRRPEQLPGNILIVDIATGEYKEVKPVYTKIKPKNKRSKKRVKK